MYEQDMKHSITPSQGDGKTPYSNSSSKELLSVVVPIYFEEEVISEFHRRLHNAMASMRDHLDYEILYVNDGSTDNSLPLLHEIFQKDPDHIRIIDFSRNFGHQLAITAGIDHAKGDSVVLIDGDLQDPPEVICQMVEKWREGYEVVYGVRSKRKGETAFKLLTAKIFYRTLSSFSDVPLPVDAGDFRLIDRKVVNVLKNIREENRYIRGLISWLGFRQFGLLYNRDERFAGETKYTLRKMLRFAADGVTSFSDKPLMMAAYCGMFFSAMGFLGALWIILQTLIGNAETAKGWASLAVMILFFGGFQMIFLGILGMYVGRIYREAKARPLYIVAQTFGIKDPYSPSKDLNHRLL